MPSHAAKTVPPASTMTVNRADAASGMETQTAKPRVMKCKVMLALAGAGTVAFLLVLLLSVILGNTETYPQTKPQRTTLYPEEAAMVLGVLNTSVDPCEDFYAYVCSRIDSGDSSHYALVTRAVLGWALLDYAAWGAQHNTAGNMIAFLMKGAWQVSSQSSPPAQELVHYATAVLNVASLNGSADLNFTKAVWLLARLSLRYGVPVVLAFNVSTSGDVLKLERNDGCFENRGNENISIQALMAVNDALNTSVSMNDVLTLERALPVRQDAGEPENIANEIASSPFKALSNFEWRAIVKELVFPVYPNLTSIVMRREDKISDVMEFLANRTHGPVFIVYMTTCAAIRLRNRVEELAVSHAPSITTACEALDVCEIVDRLKASVVSSRVMDDYVRELFAQIRRNVIEQAARHALFDGVSNQNLALELDRVKLMLPEQTAVSDIPVPDISETFPATYLAARSYTFDVRSAKVARQIPSSDSLLLPLTVRRSDVIYVPTNLYPFLHDSHGKVYKVLDLPVIGVDLALSLWSYLLENRWPNETGRNIESRLKCVRSAYINDSGPTDYQRTVNAALGLESVFDAMVSPKWRTSFTVNSTEVSVGQLVYLLWTYYQCHSLRTLMPEVDVNFVLRNSQAFTDAFGCSKNSPMAQRIECFDKDWLNMYPYSV